jgi:hypothetical protein
MAPYFYFRTLLQKESFKEIYNSVFENVKSNLVSSLEKIINNIDAGAYSQLIDIENLRWGTNIKHLEVQKEQYLSWISTQINLLSETI